MPIKKRDDLYKLFDTGNKPTRDDFTDLIDSMINIEEDGIYIADSGKPMEIINQGNEKRYIDFSESKETPRWRINGQSDDGIRQGLNVTSSKDKSCLFISQDNNCTGIGNDTPEAQLHIKTDTNPKTSAALRVDDKTNTPALAIGTNGNMGIGTIPGTDKVTIEGTVAVSGPVQVENGITVTQAAVNAQKGLMVTEGATIETGVLTAKQGIAVSGAELTAGNGALINGFAPDSDKGLIVDKGIAATTGTIEAQAGAVVSGAELTVENGLTARGLTTIYDGASIETGTLTARAGISVTDGSTLSANGPVTLGDGMTAGADVTTNGTLFANKGISVEASSLEAKLGAVITGAELEAKDGLRVNNGAVIETGTLEANGGISVDTDSSLQANGIVELGNDLTGTVAVNGALSVNQGAVVSGGELTVQEGLSVTGSILQAEEALIENAVVDKLDVSNINVTEGLGLSATYLQYMTSSDALLDKAQVEGRTVFNGDCFTASNVLLGGGKLVVTYEGPAGEEIIIDVVAEEIPGAVITTGAGHFNIEIINNLTKRLIITYNAASDIEYFSRDWEDYKAVVDPALTEGIMFRRIGNGYWEPRATQITMSSSENVFEELRIPLNGIRILYTGPQAMPAVPATFSMEPNTNYLDQKFDFAVEGTHLTIKYPGDINNSVAGKLLNDWVYWKQRNAYTAQYFDIFQRIDDTWLVKDVTEAKAFVDTGLVIRKNAGTLLDVTHTGSPTMADMPKIYVTAAGPYSDNGITFATKYDTLEILLGKVDNTPQTIYNAWSVWKKTNNTYSFDIKSTDDITPIVIEQQSALTADQAEIDVSGIHITYTGTLAETDTITIKFVESVNGFTFDYEPTGKVLTITYPQAIIERDRDALVLAWEGLTLSADDPLNDFALYLSEDDPEFYVQQQDQIAPEITAKISEYYVEKEGVDGFYVEYIGPAEDTPKISINPNAGNVFFIDIVEAVAPETDKTLVIEYPADKSKLVADFMLEWDVYTHAIKDNFKIKQFDVFYAPVEDIIETLALNTANHVLYEGAIRTTMINFGGALRFDNSYVEIQAFSNDEYLDDENIPFPANNILPTQQAVKTYVDNGLAEKALLEGDSTQAFATADLTVSGSLGFDTETRVNAISTDITMTTPSDEKLVTQKTVKTYVDNGLAPKANQADVDAALALKADQTAVDTALALKADQTAVDTALALKADQTAVDTALALKADQTAVDTALALKADQTAVDTALALKADQMAVDTALALKADQTAVDTALALKADQTAVDTALALKADQTAVDTALALKADQTAVDTALALKADQTDLASRAGMQKLTNSTVGPNTLYTVTGIDFTADSAGMLVMTVTTPADKISGLFAIHGENVIVKIAGDTLSTDENGATYNIYHNGTNYVVQNTATIGVTIDLTYIGS